MAKLYPILILLLLIGTHMQARAAVACSATATTVSGVYNSGSNLNLTGTITINCTRASGDSANQTIYIGIDNGVNNRRLTRQTATTTLNYVIYRLSNYTGTWNTGTGRNATSTAAGGSQFTLSFGSALSASTSRNYYLRVASGQTGKAAGIYDDTAVGVIVRLNSSSGAVLTNSTFVANASIPNSCRISSTPAALSLVYTSFATGAQTGSTPFGVSCTMSTPYTMALSATSGTLLGLNYTLALSASSGVGTGFQTIYNVNGSIAAGQAGTCTTAICTASQSRTITITY